MVDGIVRLCAQVVTRRRAASCQNCDPHAIKDETQKWPLPFEPCAPRRNSQETKFLGVEKVGVELRRYPGRYGLEEIAIYRRAHRTCANGDFAFENRIHELRKGSRRTLVGPFVFGGMPPEFVAMLETSWGAMVRDGEMVGHFPNA